MKNLRLQEYQGKTNKYDLTLSKKSPMTASVKKLMSTHSMEKQKTYTEDQLLSSLK